MYTETRKIHLLEEVLKINNEAALIELETVLQKSKKNKVAVKEKKHSIYDFVGILTKKEANQMSKAIKETAEI